MDLPSRLEERDDGSKMFEDGLAFFFLFFCQFFLCVCVLASAILKWVSNLYKEFYSLPANIYAIEGHIRSSTPSLLIYMP